MRALAIIAICLGLFFGCASQAVKDTTYSYGGLPMDDPLRSTAEFKAGHPDSLE